MLRRLSQRSSLIPLTGRNGFAFASFAMKCSCNQTRWRRRDRKPMGQQAFETGDSVRRDLTGTRSHLRQRLNTPAIKIFVKLWGADSWE